MNQHEEDFRVVLSPVQLAAILEHQSLTTGEIVSNRIFGGLRIVGGVIELLGAGALCAIPEPTMLSKAGCVAVGVHASDQLAAGTRQLLSGEEVNSYAFKSGLVIASELGASRGAGQVIGLATEFAVPLSTASIYNAFRVSSVQAGRMTVSVSERPMHAPRKLGGGHSFEKHIGMSLDFLKARAMKKGNTKMMSTFDNAEVAEWAVSQALQRNKLRIAMMSKLKWKHATYAVEADLNKVVGFGISPQALDVPVQMTRVKVVIKFEEFNNMPMYILTAYPIP